jgi:hypothetical protein
MVCCFDEAKIYPPDATEGPQRSSHISMRRGINPLHSGSAHNARSPFNPQCYNQGWEQDHDLASIMLAKKGFALSLHGDIRQGPKSWRRGSP